jgi:hypothetical protein
MGMTEGNDGKAALVLPPVIATVSKVWLGPGAGKVVIQRE